MGRPKQNRTILQVRVAPDTPKKLKEMALKLGYKWGADGNTGAFLDAITGIEFDKLGDLIKQKNDVQTP